MSGPIPEIPLESVVAGLERRVRRLELEGVPPSMGVRVPEWFEWSDEKIWATLKGNGWSLVYSFIGLVDLVAFLRFHDWILFCGAIAMACFAWLSWKGSDVGP